MTGGRAFVGPTGVTSARPNIASIWARTLTLVYQRRTASRDRAIADSLDAMVAALKAEDSDGPGHVGDTATG